MFIAGCLARDSYLLTSHNALDTTAELLRVDGAEAVAKLVADLPVGRRRPRPGDHPGARPRSTRIPHTQGRLAQCHTQLEPPRQQRRLSGLAVCQRLPPTRAPLARIFLGSGVVA